MKLFSRQEKKTAVRRIAVRGTIASLGITGAQLRDPLKPLGAPLSY